MKILKLGSRGTDVYILQLALDRAGYLNEEPDGIFGARTQNAVLRFQGDNNYKLFAQIGSFLNVFVLVLWGVIYMIGF